MVLRRSLLGVLSLILIATAISFAQQSPTPQEGLPGQKRERREGGRQRMGGRTPRLFRFGRELNFSDEQRQQVRSIVERQMESTKAQREELFSLREKRRAGAFSSEDEARARALRQEIHESMRGIHGEIGALLTPVQRTQLEELKNQRKARHEERRQRRQERLKDKPQ